MKLMAFALTVTLALLALTAVSAQGGSSCRLPSSFGTVAAAVSLAQTTCAPFLAGTGRVPSGQTCNVGCNSFFALQGGSAFSCGEDASSSSTGSKGSDSPWMQQQRCASLPPQGLTGLPANQPSDALGYLSARVIQTASAAAAQIARHAATNQTSSITGWRIALLRWSTPASPVLWLSRDGLNWISRGKQPGNSNSYSMVVDKLGQISLLDLPNSGQGVYRYRNENLTSSVYENTGLKSPARINAGTANHPDNPALLIYAGGMTTATTPTYFNDVWSYEATNFTGVGTHMLVCGSAPWPARRFPQLSFVPPALNVSAGEGPALPLQLLLSFGASGPSAMTDIWISADGRGASWRYVTAAPSFALGLDYSQVIIPAGRIPASITFGNIVWLMMDFRTLYQLVLTNKGNASLSLVTHYQLLPYWSNAVTALDAAGGFFPAIIKDQLIVFASPGTDIMRYGVLAQAAMTGFKIFDQNGAELAITPAFDWSIRSYTVALNSTSFEFTFAATYRYGEVSVSCDAGSQRIFLFNGTRSTESLGCDFSASATDGNRTLRVLTADASFAFTIVLPQVISIALSTPALADPSDSLELPAWSLSSPDWFSPAFDIAVFSYQLLISAFQTFPSSLDVSVGLTYGPVSLVLLVGSEIVDTVVVTSPDPVSLNLTRAFGQVRWHVATIELRTSGPTYIFTLNNPCAFLSGERFARGGTRRCPPFSACIPVGLADWTCSPSLEPLSLRRLGAVGDPEPVDYGVVLNGTDGPFRVVTLPPLLSLLSTAGVVLQVTSALTSSLPVDFASFSLNLTFTSLYGDSGIGACIQSMGSVDLLTGLGVLECMLPAGAVSGSMQLQLTACGGLPLQCVRTSSVDRFRTPPPAFVPFTLKRINPTPIATVGISGDLVAVGMSESLEFQTLNIRAIDAEVEYSTASFIPPLLAEAALDPMGLMSHERFINLVSGISRNGPFIVCSPTMDLVGLLRCTTPSGGMPDRQNMHFVAWVGGAIAVSNDTISYPRQPRVEQVKGSPNPKADCRSLGNTTIECPTVGGNRITIIGSGFSSDSAATVGGFPCTDLQYVSFNEVNCLLPAQTGESVAVAVYSYGLLSPSAFLLSYAAPFVTQIRSSICNTSSLVGPAGGQHVELSGCRRQDLDSAWTGLLEIEGRNFGASDAVVFIGSTPCDRAGFDLMSNDSYISCWMRPSKAQGQAVIVIQRNGRVLASEHTVSFQQCTEVSSTLTPSVLRSRNQAARLHSHVSCCLALRVQGQYDTDPSNVLDLTCSLCPAGSFNAFIGGVCTACPAGYISADGASGCEPCGPRTFQSSTGQDRCLSCGQGEYAPNMGSTACSSCAASFYLSSDSPFARIDDCAPCPSGGQCSGQLITSAPNSYLQLSSSGEIMAYSCPSGYCAQCNDMSLTSNNASDVHSAVATIRTCCGPNRDPSSALCGECLPGYESWGNACKRCVQSEGSMVFLFILLSSLLVIWLAHSASNASVGLTSIALYFLQTTSLELGQTALLLSWVRALNFDPDFLTSGSSTCPLKLSAYGQVVLAIVMPFILLAELAVLAIVHAIAKRVIGPPADPSANPLFSLPRWAMRCSLRYYTNAAVAVLLFSYTAVASAVIQSLWCVQVGMKRVVFSAPSMDCDSAHYKQLLPLVLVALVTFTIGFPLLVLAGGFWRHRSRSGLVDTKTIAVTAATSLIPLYGVYRPAAWFWSSYVLARRSIFVLLDVSLAAQPRFRNASFTFANLVAYALSLYTAPFPTEVLNRVEAASQFVLVVLSLLITAQLPEYTDAVNNLLFIVVLGTIVLFLVMALWRRRAVVTEKRSKQAGETQPGDDPGVQLADINATLNSSAEAASDEFATPASPSARVAASHQFDPEDASLQVNPAVGHSVHPRGSMEL